MMRHTHESIKITQLPPFRTTNHNPQNNPHRDMRRGDDDAPHPRQHLLQHALVPNRRCISATCCRAWSCVHVCYQPTTTHHQSVSQSASQSVSQPPPPPARNPKPQTPNPSPSKKTRLELRQARLEAEQHQRRVDPLEPKGALRLVEQHRQVLPQQKQDLWIGRAQGEGALEPLLERRRLLSRGSCSETWAGMEWCVLG